MLFNKIVYGIPLVAIVVGAIYLLGGFGFLVFLVVILAAIFAELYKSAKGADLKRQLFCGILFVLVLEALQCLFIIRMLHGPRYILAIFIAAWSNDSLAYFFGRYGKHHFTKISPKKTLEGLVAGTIASLLAAILMLSFGFLPTKAAISIGISAAVLGPTGDLLFSLLKRQLGIKDFSSVIPGHGGIMDRFDSLILTTIGVWIVLQLL